MLLILDRDINNIVVSVGSRSPLSACQAKRGANQEVCIQLVKAGIIVQLAVDEELKYVVKPVGKYDGTPLAAAEPAAFVWDATSELYRAPVSYLTPALNALFNVDLDDTNDVSSLSLGVEIGIRPDAVTDYSRSENDVTLTLRNNYLRDDEGALPPADSTLTWLEDNRAAVLAALGIVVTNDELQITCPDTTVRTAPLMNP